MRGLPSVNELIELAKTDPDKLEQLRLQEIETIIASAPQHLQRRLRGLQFQIDCQRRLHRTRLGACIAISRMMLDSVQQLQQAVNGKHISTVKHSSPQIIPLHASSPRAPSHIQ